MAENHVVVAGGGVIGLGLSLALARIGCRVSIIEKAPAETFENDVDNSRAFLLAQPSVKMLEELSVWPQVQRLAYPVADISVSDRLPERRDAAHPLVFGHRGRKAQPLGCAIAERHLRRALAQRVRESDLIRLYLGETITAQYPAAGAMRIALSGGRALEAALLVGCEGRHSPTARAAGIDYRLRDFGQVAFVMSARHSHANRQSAYQYLLPGGPLTVLPIEENATSLTWALPAEEAEAVRALAPHAFEARLREVAGPALGDFALSGPVRSFPLCGAMARRFAAERLALAGDAAHVFHPVTGQGVNYGFRDIAELSRRVVEAKARGQDIAGQAILAGYARRRRADAALMGLVTGSMLSVLAGNHPLVGVGRRSVIGALGSMPPMRHFLVRKASGRDLRLERLPAEGGA